MNHAGNHSGLIAQRRLLGALVTAAFGCLLGAPASAQDPGGARWIWGTPGAAAGAPAGDTWHFRHAFEVQGEVSEGTAWVSCDNDFELWLNGQHLGKGRAWERAEEVDLGPALRPGRNVLAVRAHNEGGPAGLVLFAEIQAGGRLWRVQSGPDWRARAAEEVAWSDADHDDGDWSPAADLGAFGMAPWTGVTIRETRRFGPLPGFVVETAAPTEDSLVAVANSAPGEVFVSRENGDILRLKDADGDGFFEQEDLVSDLVKGCHGLCVVGGHLFAVGRGPEGMGLYRFDDLGGTPRLLGRLEGSGEHGPHAVVEGPDGFLYVIIGNHTRADVPLSPESPYRITYEGHLLPTMPDPGGHARGRMAPGGVVLRTDREGRSWELVCGGLRNTYDLAFTPSGDLFGFDADMEWDVGLPWYRPLLLVHFLPGGEYGWRNGSGKWTLSHPDALPPAAEAGRGSPTGIVCYDGQAFPTRFQGSLLAGDWSAGEIRAFHLTPEGASYRAEEEVLLRGRPLNITDLVVAEDGSVLFTLGGRDSRGGLLRLRYQGEESRDPPAAPTSPAPRLTGWDRNRLTRALGAEDRVLRFLAARELERRRDAPGFQRVLDVDPRPLAKAEACLALARLGLEAAGAGAAPPVPLERCLREAAALAVAPRDDAVLRTALRALQLVLIAMGDAGPGHPALAEVCARESTGEPVTDRLLAELVAAWNGPGVASRLTGEMRALPSLLERMHRLDVLRHVTQGWTEAAEEAFVEAWNEAGQGSGGNSFRGYLEAIRDGFLAHRSPERAAQLGPAFVVIGERQPAAIERAGASPKDYDRTLSYLRRTGSHPGRSREEGALVFRDLCSRCHSHGVLGQGLGPDLGTVGGRFDLGDILQALSDPARTVSDQYQSTNLFLTNGDVQTGLLIAEEEDSLLLLLSSGEQLQVPRQQVRGQRPSQVSIMPQGLLDPLTMEEVADLLAFLRGSPLDRYPQETTWQRLLEADRLLGFPSGQRPPWTVQHAVLEVQVPAGAEEQRWWSEDSFADFDLEFEVWWEAGTGGLGFRALAGASPEAADWQGYVLPLAPPHWGALHERGGRGVLAGLAREIAPALWKDGDWNHFRIRALGSRLQVDLNGTTTVAIDDDRNAQGRLVWFAGAAADTRMLVRNLRIRPLR